ncbi:GTP-binding protein [Paenibacillus sp. 32O-W]|uniref:putative glycoside hydrolase n=1 Tax=Paenibacillus sp. 32O-W TaxID=1695218 RepID=UPI0007220A18|nr:putative glycoside hydrolase [Paenibacillus sp. 32O-W]ALS25710.1 GTP-binding protein [Paenibacillus sp. 32O-W]
MAKKRMSLSKLVYKISGFIVLLAMMAQSSDGFYASGRPESAFSLSNDTGKETAKVTGKAANNEANASEKFPRKQMAEPVRGIYMSGWVAGSVKSRDRLLRLMERTDLNAVVIDVKNEYGALTYRSKVDEVRSLGADRQPLISDIRRLLKELHDRKLYVIGRVVVFKDPYLAAKKPQYAIRRSNGELWRDSQGKVWIDPFDKSVWIYNIRIAEEAVRLGFDEIQFDYVRFPDGIGGNADGIVYRNPERWTREEAIGRFLREAKPVIHRAGGRLSADVFGLVTTSEHDMGIGQTWRNIASSVDVISPMVYPSHYSEGIYGVRYPDLEPYTIISRAMRDASLRNQALRREGIQGADIRPWLQSFTATWLPQHQHYDFRQLREQIRALKDQGIEQFLLWSPNCKYDYRSSAASETDAENRLSRSISLP